MIGARRHRIELQEEVKPADTGGGYTLSWATRATVSASIKPVSGSEQLRSAQLEARVTHKIETRYRRDVALTAKWRVKFGTRVFNIRTVINEDERGRTWILKVDEGMAT